MYGFESYDEKWVFVSDFNNGYSPEKAFKLAYTNNQTKSLTDETRRSLINLGYTSAEIAYAFNNVKINKKDDLSDCISKCIKVIALS
jgi:Holliday junction resolvasome RuvABC DNA-binding subunit